MEATELRELVIAAQGGDTGAFAEVVRRFEGMAQRLGMAMLGERSRAEDAAQEAFLDAYISLGSLREPAAFPGWFRRIVLKHCDRQLRRDHGEVPLYQLSHSRKPLLSRSPLKSMDYYERSYPDAAPAHTCGAARARWLPAQPPLALPFHIPRLWRALVARPPG